MYKNLKIILLIAFMGLVLASPASANPSILMNGSTPTYSTGGISNGFSATYPENITDRNFSTYDNGAILSINGLAGKYGYGYVIQDFGAVYRINSVRIKGGIGSTSGCGYPVILASNVQNYNTGLWEYTNVSSLYDGQIYNNTNFYNGSIYARNISIKWSFACPATSVSLSLQNYELQVYGEFSNDTLNIISPLNNSTNNYRPQILQWSSTYNNYPYTYNTSTSPTMSPIYQTGTVSSYTSYDGSYYYWQTPTLYFLPNTTYYWTATDKYGNTKNSKFTTIYEPPGALNVSVYDEQTLAQVFQFNTTIYSMNGNSVTKSTFYGYTNFTTNETQSYEYPIGSGIFITKYIIMVIPYSNITSYTETVTNGNTTETYLITNGSGYSPRTIFANSPGNIKMYVPSLLEPNVVVFDQFKLGDLTGAFPISNSYITVTFNNTTMFKGYFDASGNVNVWLIQGVRYGITVTNDLTGEVYNFGNYVPQYSQVVPIDISLSFSPDFNELSPIVYNVTGNYSGYYLQWADNGNIMNSLTFKVYNSTNIIDTYTSAVSFGNHTKLTGYAGIFNYTLSILLDNGQYLNSSNRYDFQNSGIRVNNTGTSIITGQPIGTGFIWNYGTYTTPEWVYTWVSIILIVLSVASWNALSAPLGCIISLLLTLILEVWGLFRPTWDITLSDAANYPTHLLLMSITGGLVVLAILYYLQNKERGG